MLGEAPTGPAIPNLVDWHEPNGVAPCAGAVDNDRARASWRPSGRDGLESIHLYQFIVHTARYGSWETAGKSPDISLGGLKLRKGGRFLYEYDLNIPWEQEIRLEERFTAKARTHYPTCINGHGNCPLEDCGGPEAWI